MTDMVIQCMRHTVMERMMHKVIEPVTHTVTHPMTHTVIHPMKHAVIECPAHSFIVVWWIWSFSYDAYGHSAYDPYDHSHEKNRNRWRPLGLTPLKRLRLCENLQDLPHCMWTYRTWLFVAVDIFISTFTDLTGIVCTSPPVSMWSTVTTSGALCTARVRYL